MSGGGGGNRYKFGGLKQDGGSWRVRIGVGCVHYHQIVLRRDFQDEGERASRFTRGIFPTVEVDGNDVRIDDPSKPALALGSLTAATVWLVMREEKCNSASSLDTEKLVITEREAEPEIERGQVAVQIVDFDVETTTSEAGEKKRATNVVRYLESDWEQPYLCDDDNSRDSYDGSDFGSSFDEEASSGGGDSTPPGSSDSDGTDPDGECQVRMVAGWDNGVACFPKDMSAPEFCLPEPFSFEVRVKFIFRQPFGGVACTNYAYGVSMAGGIIQNPPEGSTATEYRWRNDTDRELTFYVDDPPACGEITLNWRVKTFPAASGFGGTPPEDQGCCGQEFSGTTVMVLRDAITTGPFTSSKTRLPAACGCTCSSSVIDSGSSTSSAP